MKLIFLAAVVTLASAAQLPSRNSIPQGQGQRPGYSGFGGKAQDQNQYGELGGIGGNGNGNRPQWEAVTNAAILKQDQSINEDGSYNLFFETENGIKAEEVGNPAEARGEFSYKGDDGVIYTITYTAGEGGFKPQGEHLPIAPPTPEAILKALEKNAQDEAAGIFDDGVYRPDVGSGSGGNFKRPGEV